MIKLSDFKSIGHSQGELSGHLIISRLLVINLKVRTAWNVGNSLFIRIKTIELQEDWPQMEELVVQLHADANVYMKSDSCVIPCLTH